MEIYPNPFNDQLVLQAGSGNRILSVSLYNILGDQVYRADCRNNAELILRPGKIPKGLYILKVETTGGDYLKKIYKE